MNSSCMEESLVEILQIYLGSIEVIWVVTTRGQMHVLIKKKLLLVTLT